MCWQAADGAIHVPDDAQPTVAVILAAGEGRRMSNKFPDKPKPLVPLLGLPIIERTMLACAAAGVRQFVVVLGYQADRVRAGVEELAGRRGWPVRFVTCQNWQQGNGASALAAAEAVGTRECLLLMADHLLDPALIQRVCEADWHDSDVMLAVDFDRAAIYDPEEVTRVQVEAGRLTAIGKAIDPWNAADTGVFRCRPALFDALREVQAEGQFGLSDAVARLAEAGRARAVDVTGCHWLDVDTAEAYREACRRLLAGLGKGRREGYVSAYLNRPISSRISALLVDTALTPDQLSVLGFLGMLIAAVLLALPLYWSWLAGGLLVQFCSILDGCDGEVARLRHRCSARGAWLDTMLDRYGDLAVALAIIYRAGQRYVCPWLWPAGFVAAAGFVLAGYVGKEHALRFGRPYPHDLFSRLKCRDLRLLTIAAGAVVGYPYLALLAIGLVTHMCILGTICRGWFLAGGSASAAAGCGDEATGPR